MHTSYLVAGGSGLVAVLLVFGTITLIRRRSDITNKKIALPSGLAVSREMLKSQKWSSDFVLGSIQDGVAMVGRDNLIHLFNPGASDITGWSGEEAVGLDFHNVLVLVDEHGLACPPDSHPFAKALGSGQTVRDNKALLITRAGKKIPLSIVVSPLNPTPGKLADTVVGVFRDVSDEKAEERQRSDFISTASHEMRTPIAAIEGYLSLALNPKITKLDNNSRKYLEKAATSIKHLGELSQDLLTSSRADDGRLASFPEVVELGKLVEQVADAARYTAQKKGLSLRYVVSNDKDVMGGKVIRPLYYTVVDPNRLREMLQNLIDNAIKYTAGGGITIRLTGDASVVQLQVQDTGPGIPKEDVPHLFQKFYRVDNSLTRTVGGTGLGLFISRKIVEMYQGRIWVESQLGKGSTFYINLSRLTTAQAQEAQKSQAALISPLDNQ